MLVLLERCCFLGRETFDRHDRLWRCTTFVAILYIHIVYCINWLMAFFFLMRTMPINSQDNPEHIQCPSFSLRNGECKIETKPLCFLTASSQQSVTSPGNRNAVLSPRRSGKRQLRILGSQALVPFEQGQESLCRSQAGFWGKCLSDCWECAGVLEDARLQGRCAEFFPLLFAVSFSKHVPVCLLKCSLIKDW